MGVQISTNEINKYLLRIKQAVSIGNYRFEKRKKNVDSLAKIGLLPSHVKLQILKLTYLNYFNGPEPERDSTFTPGEYMFFGCDVNGLEFIIKLKLEDAEGSDFCVCISFHEAERPIYYPYKTVT